MTATVTNNAVGFLAESIGVDDTQLTLVQGAVQLFPSISGAQYFFVTVVDQNNQFEIVKVTSVDGDVFTIERGAESTNPKTFPVYSRVELRVTAGNVDLTKAAIAAMVYKNTRPGDSPTLFDLGTAAIEGSVNGQIVRVTGSTTITSKVFMAIEPGQYYNLKFAYQRFTDSGDPSNDGITGGVIWYNGFKNELETEVIHEDNTLLTTSNRRDFSYSIAAPGISDVNVYAPAGARYAVAWIKTFGTDHVTDIEICGLVPATEPATNAPSADNITFPSGFQWPAGTIPPGAGTSDEYEVARTFYVTMDGNDSNDGTSLSEPKATIGSALAAAAALEQPCVVIVHPGEYTVQPDTEIPTNCTLYGYDLRATKLSLPQGQEENNMFLLNSGIKARGLTFTNLRHEAQPSNWSSSYDYPYPPQKGYAFAFKPGAFITRSPYIADCSMLHNLTQREMTLPTLKPEVASEIANPEIPRTGGNLIADGSVLAPSSPLRSVVVDSFTSINPNGVGYLIQKNAFVQLVSVFTNWSRVGLWSHLGGHVTVANSNNTFGDISLLATDFRYFVEVNDDYEHSAAIAQHIPIADEILEQIDDIIDEMYIQLADEFATVQNFTSEQEELTRRDARTLLQNLSDDFRSGQDRGSRFFLKGLFDWDADPVFSASLLPEFVRSWEIIEARVLARCSLSTPAADMLETLIEMITDVVTDAVTDKLNSEYVLPFGSLVEATGQQISYGGSGVNYNALPSSQRGTGESSPVESIQEFDGGRIFATFGTENGDTYLGKDLRVDFERSVIEGQAFSRGVQNIALPLIVGLGGN